MGVSTDGILAYGYNLGGADAGWEIQQADEDGEWTPVWASDPDDLIGDVEKVLLAAMGFTETDYQAEGYFDRQREAQQRVGVEIESFCSGDYPMYVLAAHAITAHRGHVKAVDFVELDKLRVEQAWDAKLKRAAEALGITPKQATPVWLLVSYWG